VVRDTHPQKLMIVVQDDIKDDRLNNIKQHILKFIKKKPIYASMTTSDLTVYNCDNNTEIVVSSLKFNNIHEKETFIEAFIIFMQEQGEGDIADKIQLRHPPSNVPGTRYYQLPCSKTLVDGTASDVLSQLMTTSRTPSVVINNTFIIQNNVQNTNNTVNNIGTVITTQVEDGKSLKSFYKHIYNTKPSWYTEHKLVDFSIIVNAYQEYFEDYDTKTMVISRQLNKHLYKTSTRINKVVKKKLVSYDELKSSF
jgi:hypothetical protein